MKDERIIIVGAFHEIIELAEECGKKIAGIIDNKLKDTYMGYKILGTDKMSKMIRQEYKLEKLILSPDLPKIRNKLFHFYSELNWEFDTLISPESRLSKGVIIEEGSIIHRFVNISNNTKIGKFVRVNVSANIMHDCQLGEFSTVAPNAVILGNINVGNEVYIGANSTILPNLIIGDCSMVGAGSVVTKNVKGNTTVVGNPARNKE